jgi:hypothetical protein
MGAMMATAKIQRCSRCGRRLRNSGADWACFIDFGDDALGAVTETYCPKCTTSEEHIRREINDATTDYVWVDDRVAMFPKLEGRGSRCGNSSTQ